MPVWLTDFLEDVQVLIWMRTGGAWVRNQMMKWLLPLGAKGMDFMYAYDARAV